MLTNEDLKIIAWAKQFLRNLIDMNDWLEEKDNEIIAGLHRNR